MRLVMIFFALAVPASLLPGCGARAVPSGGESPTGANDAEDAVILALRHQDSIELDRNLLRAAGEALARARALIPELEEVHAIPYRVEHELILSSTDDRVVDAWGRGQLETGIAELDHELQRFGAHRVEASSGRYHRWFTVHFDRPLALGRLASRLHRLPAIESGPNGGGSWGLPEEDIEWERLDEGELLTFVGVEPVSPPQTSCYRRRRWRVEVSTAGAVLREFTSDCVCLTRTERC
jgi:hypothetical protein